MVTRYPSSLLTLTATLFTSFCMAALPASSRDNGQYADVNPKIKSWIEGLKNSNGTPCCSTADGFTPEDVEYDTQGGNYRVKIRNQWFVIQHAQLLTEPNMVGRAIVWYNWPDGEKQPYIYCFIPGALT